VLTRHPGSCLALTVLKYAILTYAHTASITDVRAAFTFTFNSKEYIDILVFEFKVTKSNIYDHAYDGCL